MTRVFYNKRTWLNGEGSDATSSVVAFDGEVTYDNKYNRSTFLEISDCRNKIRLHITTDDTTNNFIEKLETLKHEVNLFINHLKEMEEATK